MKKLAFALMAFGILLFASCEASNTADEDQLYHQGVDKSKITKDNKGQ